MNQGGVRYILNHWKWLLFSEASPLKLGKFSPVNDHLLESKWTRSQLPAGVSMIGEFSLHQNMFLLIVGPIKDLGWDLWWRQSWERGSAALEEAMVVDIRQLVTHEWVSRERTTKGDWKPQGLIWQASPWKFGACYVNPLPLHNYIPLRKTIVSRSHHNLPSDLDPFLPWKLCLNSQSPWPSKFAEGYSKTNTSIKGGREFMQK